MSQKQAKFLAMLLGLSMLAGCSSAGGGRGSTPAPTGPAPTVTLSANPLSIFAGQSVTLTWTSANATLVVIDNNVGAAQPVIGGSDSVSPTQTTTYTITATGPGGSATAQATVTVTPLGPAPTVTLSASSTSSFAGQSISLTWTSTNATSVLIDSLGPVLPVSGGNHSVSPTQTTTYTITATTVDGQQATATATVTVAPVNSFDGIAQDLTIIPPPRDVDPNGAVGTKQFMEYVNPEFQAFDKTTFQPVWGKPQPIGTPWNAIPECAGSAIALDAVINFDRLASRWVIAAKSFIGPNSVAPENYYFCIAVSSTDDLTSPTLTWYAYFYVLTPYFTNSTTGQVYLPDWSKLGTWPDAYYATMDMFDNVKGLVVGVVACALDRTNILLNGTPNPMQCVTVSGPQDSGVYLGHSLIPADVEGTTPPPPGRDEFMVSIQNPSIIANATTSDTINLWDFHVDWPSAKLTYTLTPLPVTPYTPGCYLYLGSPATTNCVPEPQAGGIAQHIDSLGDRFMPRLAYRNFGTYESFLVSHTVQTGLNASLNPLQTGVRWYELRDNLTELPFVYQSSTINPDASLFRFLPSIAQDKVGNAAVGYSVSNFFTDPGINFSYWNLATSSAPTAEVTILNGTAEEITPTTGYGEWGSYSSMTVDPVDNCTFWYVNEYWTLLSGQTDSSWATRIANFTMPTCQ